LVTFRLFASTRPKVVQDWLPKPEGLFQPELDTGSRPVKKAPLDAEVGAMVRLPV
jgi:hypothetical protein